MFRNARRICAEDEPKDQADCGEYERHGLRSAPPRQIARKRIKKVEPQNGEHAHHGCESKIVSSRAAIELAELGQARACGCIGIGRFEHHWIDGAESRGCSPTPVRANRQGHRDDERSAVRCRAPQGLRYFPCMTSVPTKTALNGRYSARVRSQIPMHRSAVRVVLHWQGWPTQGREPISALHPGCKPIGRPLSNAGRSLL